MSKLDAEINEVRFELCAEAHPQMVANIVARKLREKVIIRRLASRSAIFRAEATGELAQELVALEMPIN